jgi:hypothetical protein
MRIKVKKKVGNQYLPTHAKFLRKGDDFRMFFGDGTNVDLTALSDPFIDPKSGEWSVKIDDPYFDDERA